MHRSRRFALPDQPASYDVLMGRVAAMLATPQAQAVGREMRNGELVLHVQDGKFVFTRPIMSDETGVKVQLAMKMGR